MSHLKLITINSTTVKAVYTNTSSKIIIICPIHGEFTQLAGSHLSGQGAQNVTPIVSENRLVILSHYQHKHIRINIIIQRWNTHHVMLL
jgi:subtilase family serine protease